MARVVLGSYAFRYAVGSPSFRPAEPMDAAAFLDAAARLRCDGVQLCENLAFDALPATELDALRRRAADLGLFVEVGMKELTADSGARHLEIARRLGAPLLRIVAGDDFDWRRAEADRQRVLDLLRPLVASAHDDGIHIGLENRFDLRSVDLAWIAEQLGDDHFGLILDTTNGIGFVEHPRETLERFLPHLLSVHLKDFVMEKVEAEYRMRGTVLGEGWLDAAGLLRRAVERHRDLSVVVEMTVQRDLAWDAQRVLAWERDAVQRSVEHLRRILCRVAGASEN